MMRIECVVPLDVGEQQWQIEPRDLRDKKKSVCVSSGAQKGKGTKKIRTSCSLRGKRGGGRRTIGAWNAAAGVGRASRRDASEIADGPLPRRLTQNEII